MREIRCIVLEMRQQPVNISSTRLGGQFPMELKKMAFPGFRGIYCLDALESLLWGCSNGVGGINSDEFVTAGVLSGAGEEQYFKKYNADYIIQDISEIPVKFPKLTFKK